LPPLLACRPTTPILGDFTDPTPWRISSLHSRDGELLLLERREQKYAKDIWANTRDTHVYVDPNKDFHIVKYEEYMGDNLTFTLDINYNEHEELGWVPDTWKGIIMQYRDGEPGLHQQFEGSVTKISTDYIPPEVFEPKFPEGVIVTDHRTNTKWMSGPNGEKLPVPPTPEQLAQLATGRSQNLVFVCTLLAIIALAFSFVTWRAWRRARAAA
jgi:hypothetical protein